MCATSCALLAPIAFAGNQPALAGSWKYTVTGDSTETYTDNAVKQTVAPCSPAASGTGSSVVIFGLSITRSNSGGSGIGSAISITVHAQVKFTWVPAVGQTLITDPPPTNVIIVESSLAVSSASVYAASGSTAIYGTFAAAAGDGLDPEVDTYPQAGSKTATSASPTNEGYLLTGEHLTSYPASSGVVTVPSRTLTASATTTYPLDHQ